MGATLANRGLNSVTGYWVFDAHVVLHTLAIMATKGFYDESGRWSYEVGLPAKTGGGGSIVGIVPGKLAIAAFSPRLEVAGNSVRASQAIGYVSQQLGLDLMVLAQDNRLDAEIFWHCAHEDRSYHP